VFGLRSDEPCGDDRYDHRGPLELVEIVHGQYGSEGVGWFKAQELEGVVAGGGTAGAGLLGGSLVRSAADSKVDFLQRCSVGSMLLRDMSRLFANHEYGALCFA
jgi:hypothetical protein